MQELLGVCVCVACGAQGSELPCCYIWSPSLIIYIHSQIFRDVGSQFYVMISVLDVFRNTHPKAYF